MIEGIRLSKTEFRRRYGLSEKAATRAASLLARGVALTHAVLDLFATDDAVAKVLLSRRILDAANDAERLAEYLKGSGLRATKSSDGTLLISTEEELAEESQVKSIQRAGPTSFLEADDLRAVLGHEEVLKLKLTILTSADEKEKITAIRKLALTAGGVKEKGGALISALSDRSGEVRAEAAQALVSLGLSRDVAEEARILAEGGEKERREAAERLSNSLAAAAENEAAVILSVVAGSLRNEKDPDTRAALVRAMRPACRNLKSEVAAELLRVLLETVRSEELPVLRAAEEALRDCGRSAPGVVSETIAAELRKTGSSRLRRFLLAVLDGVPLDEAQKDTLVRIALQEILKSENPESECTRLGNLMLSWGTRAIPALIEGLRSGKRPHRVFLCQLLDRICGRKGCPTDLKLRTYEAFADLLKTAPWTVRLVILESSLVVDPEIPAGSREDVARELISMLHEFNNPTILERIEATLAKMGFPAYAPALAVVKRSTRKRERAAAARVVGRLVERFTDPEVEAMAAEEAAETFLQLLDSDFPDKGVLAIALGEMCKSRVLSSTTVQRVAHALRGRLRESDYPYQALEGLGKLACGPNAPLGIKVETVGLFIGLLEERLPEFRAEARPKGPDTVFRLGAEATAYTEMVPLLLEGLGAICLSCESEVLREKIGRFLLKKWEAASTWQENWGPANTTLLLNVLGDIASRAQIEEELRADILRSLTKRMDFLPALEAIARILDAEPRSEAIGNLAGSIARHVLSEKFEQRTKREKEYEVCLDILARTAARASLGDGGESLREEILRVLFDARREGCPAALGALRLLEASPYLPEAFRSEIRRRIQSPDLPAVRGEF